MIMVLIFVAIDDWINTANGRYPFFRVRSRRTLDSDHSFMRYVLKLE